MLVAILMSATVGQTSYTYTLMRGGFFCGSDPQDLKLSNGQLAKTMDDCERLCNEMSDCWALAYTPFPMCRWCTEAMAGSASSHSNWNIYKKIAP